MPASKVCAECMRVREMASNEGCVCRRCEMLLAIGATQTVLRLLQFSFLEQSGWNFDSGWSRNAKDRMKDWGTNAKTQFSIDRASLRQAFRFEVDDQAEWLRWVKVCEAMGVDPLKGTGSNAASTPDLVPDGCGCPKCGCREMDKLEIDDDDRVRCACGHEYNAAERPADPIPCDRDGDGLTPADDGDDVGGIPY